MRPFELLCSRVDGVGVRALFHWLGGSVVKVKSDPLPLPRLLEQRLAQPPLAQEGFAALLNSCGVSA